MRTERLDSLMHSRPSQSPGETTFAELGVPETLTRALFEQGITSPFPIQRLTLPDSLAGRDLLGRGQTGSGKTIAFALPVIVRLSADNTRARGGLPRSLILVPTRELAAQVQRAVQPLAQAARLSTATVYGGVGQGPQVKALRAGVDVLIACPGRLEDLMRQGHVSLDRVGIVVIDEADHMADLGFLPAVRRIMDAVPAGGQRLLFSATLDNGVDQIVRRYLSSPVSHEVPHVPAADSAMLHHVFTVNSSEKTAVIHALASGRQRCVLFTRTKRGARSLAQSLTHEGIPAVDLHGNLSQAARDRNLAAFRDGRVRVLVATDVAARGIHVDDIALVVHVDPPAEAKAYLHRSGRTARAGASGVVVTMQTAGQRSEVTQLTKRAGVRPTISSVGPESAEVTRLVGPVADRVAAPVERPEVAAPKRPQGNQRRQSGRGEPGNQGNRGGAGNRGRGHGERSGTGAARRRSGSGTGSGRTRSGDTRPARTGR